MLKFIFLLFLAVFQAQASEFTDPLILSAGTTSTSKTTGTLIVTGGVGVSGKVSANDVNVDSATASRVVATDASKNLSSATTTLTQVNYLGSATGTTGTTSTNLVFSTSPSLTTPTIAGAALSGNLTGSPTFTAHINFGSNAGTGGQIGISNNSGITWRNAANSANYEFYVDSSNVFQMPTAVTVTGITNFNNTVNITPGTGANSLVITGPSSVSNNAGEILFKQAAQYSFLFGSGYNTTGAMEIIPSTASGGTTFSNPIFQANRTGVITIGNATLLGAHVVNGTFDVVKGVAGPGTTGNILLTDVTTNSTTKNSSVSSRHYTNSEENVGIFSYENNASANILYVGTGGTSSQNAMTNIQFWTATSNTTTLGTLRGSIDSSGLWKINTSASVFGGGGDQLAVIGTTTTDAAKAGITSIVQDNFDGVSQFNHTGVSAYYQRGLASTSRSDTGNRQAVNAQASFSSSSGTPTFTSSGFISAFKAQLPTVSGSLTLAIADFAGLNVEASSLNTGTNKYGVYIGAQTGASANYAIYTAGSAIASFGGNVTANGGMIDVGLNPDNTGLLMTNVTTNSTNKTSNISVSHYTQVEEPVGVFYVENQTSSNTIHHGGGYASLNAATNQKFYTAATNTTVTGTVRLELDTNGNIVMGTAAKGTTDTQGFFYIHSTAGLPTGVPGTTYTGRVPMQYDTTNHKICVYDPTTPSWRCSAAM